MLKVKDVNATFAEKGIHVTLPLPEEYEVDALEILQKHNTPGGYGLLLNISYRDDSGRQVSDIVFCEAKVEGKRRSQQQEIRQPAKADMLPFRNSEGFKSDEEARSYLAEAMGHLLKDKGYEQSEREGVDLYYENDGRGFFLAIAVRSDDEALEKAKRLAEIRLKYGLDHDYGLLLPAFQESLGMSLLNQDKWMWRNEEFLSFNKIGVYAVDNWNPNLIYAFTTYPKPRELKRYFMTTGSQWQMVRSRYVAGRSRRRKETED